MPNGAEIWVLSKLNDLALRFGVTPIQADFDITYREERLPPPNDGMYSLSISGTDPGTEEAQSKLEQISKLLGLENGHRFFRDIDDMDDVVEAALKLAPRARAR